MTKLTLTPISTFSNGSAVQATNENYDRIEAALENTFSRDGSTPNQLTGDLDLNSNDIINGGSLNAAVLYLAGERVVPESAVNASNFATAAQGAKADTALQPTSIGVTVQGFSSNLSAVAAAPSSSVTSALGVHNFSMPLAIDPVVVYITSTGSDATGGDLLHGTTLGTAFQTFNAAINHIKTNYKFDGRLNTVEFRFGSGDWGGLNIGSSVDAGTDWFPFAIYITSIDNLDRARFDGITVGGWLPVYVNCKQVDSSYYSVVRRNVMAVNNCGVIAGTVVPYCFRFGTMAHLYLFGAIQVKEAVSFSSGFIYGTDRAFCSMENGDVDPPFPAFVLTGQGNITSPNKYRAVLGAIIYCPTNPYPMLSYSSTYHVDAYSLSTQTQQGIDLSINTGLGGPVVDTFGDTASGYRIYADGWCEQWGSVSFGAGTIAVGKTVSAGTITFTRTFISATYNITYGTNNIGVRAGTNGSQLVGSCPFGLWNHEASTQAATVRWKASGYVT